MPILCFEGPSAVGKTTTAAALTAAAGAYIVPEVHFLFERPEHEAPEWYVERQVDRWQLATAAAQRHPLVVLDGDPYQPLWYNWAFNFAGWQELDFLEAFYRPRLARGELSFPDRYIVFREATRLSANGSTTTLHGSAGGSSRTYGSLSRSSATSRRCTPSRLIGFASLRHRTLRRAYEPFLLWLQRCAASSSL